MFPHGSHRCLTTRWLPLRIAKLLGAVSLAFVLASCAQLPTVPQTPPPPIGKGYPEQLGIGEPGPQEIVVVVNNNLKMVHAGMFAGHALLDPAGSYEHSRNQDPAWQGVSLLDYVRFQLDDGPAVKLYRFPLPPERFARIKERLDNAGRTMPLFCAAKVQNIISGIEPFESELRVICSAAIPSFKTTSRAFPVGEGKLSSFPFTVKSMFPPILANSIDCPRRDSVRVRWVGRNWPIGISVSRTIRMMGSSILLPLPI